MGNRMATLPRNITIIDLGGTITSESSGSTDEFYESSSLNIETIYKTLPLPKRFKIEVHQPFKLLSQDITNNDLIKFAMFLTDLVDTDVDGFVVAMGTNAMEEVSFFINILLKTKKPIIFTGSIRQANALGYEGGRNLYNAILLAASQECYGYGVLVCVNDMIYSARDFIKLNPSFIDAYSSNIYGPLGYVLGGLIKLCYQPNFIHTATTPFHVNRIRMNFPKTCVIYGVLGEQSFFLDSAIENKVDGIVSAGLGKGYQPKTVMQALQKASELGIFVVRCSRSGMGVVHFDENTDRKFGFIAGYSFSPAKAKILLEVALCHTKNKKELQKIFTEF